MTATATVLHYPLSFAKLTDEQIVALAQAGNTEAMEYMLRKYRPMVRRKAQTCFIQGADRIDTIQEGMIGLFKAIRDYRDDRNTTFQTFAELCVKCQIKTAISKVGDKTFASMVHFEEISARAGLELVERLFRPESQQADPYRVIASAETVRELQVVVRDLLSDFEFRVCCLSLGGLSHKQIADVLGCKPKSADNARQRIHSKMNRCIALIRR